MHQWWGGVLINGSYACVEAGGIWGISVPSTQFCCEPVTAVKTKVYFRKKRGRRQGGREGWGGRRSVVKWTLVQRWGESRCLHFQPFSPLERGPLLDPSTPFIRAHPSRVIGLTLVSEMLPPIPHCDIISILLFSTGWTIFFAKLCHGWALDSTKAVLPLTTYSNLPALLGEMWTFVNHIPFWLIFLSCPKDSFIK